MMTVLTSMLLFSVVLVGICAWNHTAGLFCADDLDDVYANGRMSRKFLVYVLVFMVPIIAIIIGEVVLCIVTFHRISIGMAARPPDDPVEYNYRKQMLLFSQRLVAYPCIFVLCWTLNVISIIHSIIVYCIYVVYYMYNMLYVYI